MPYIISYAKSLMIFEHTVRWKLTELGNLKNAVHRVSLEDNHKIETFYKIWYVYVSNNSRILKFAHLRSAVDMYLYIIYVSLVEQRLDITYILRCAQIRLNSLMFTTLTRIILLLKTSEKIFLDLIILTWSDYSSNGSSLRWCHVTMLHENEAFLQKNKSAQTTKRGCKIFAWCSKSTRISRGLGNTLDNAVNVHRGSFWLSEDMEV